MEVILLIIHLLVCVCLIGLVLLQRSEGGALGMGGGGGAGSLMSGRGAADALAKMTSVAGGFFLVTSISLTVHFRRCGLVERRLGVRQPPPRPRAAGPGARAGDGQPETTRPDPTESSIPGDTQLASAAAPATGGRPRPRP